MFDREPGDPSDGKLAAVVDGEPKRAAAIVMSQSITCQPKAPCLSVSDIPSSTAR